MQDLLNRIICGDCIEVLGKVESAGGGFADLIFADPPFNIGYKYDRYNDEVAREKYIAWTKQWMSVCKKVLKPHGSFYIAIGDDYAANVKIIADEMGLSMRNWIIWHYTFGQQTRLKFARAHTHIFYFVNDKRHFTFNDQAVRVISDRQKIYNDSRANPDGKMPDDVWNEYPRICGTFKERTGFPCQMPESLLARIIRVSSNEGDWVLDPFSGSGTTVVAAARLDRKYTGIELSKQYAEESQMRLEQSKGPAVEDKQPCEWTEQLDQELKWLYSENKIPTGKLRADAGLLGLFTRKFNHRIGAAQNSIPPNEVIRRLIQLQKSMQLSPLHLHQVRAEQAGDELFEQRKSRKLSHIKK